jgi:predicted nucleic acid-binding protein
MEQPEYLIDSNAVIDYLGKKLPETGMAFMDAVIDSVPNVSVVSMIEVLGFSTTDKYYKVLTDFMNDAIVHNLTDEVVSQSISLRKNHKVKLPDVIIAATALSLGLKLITRNTKDFDDIGVETINPWSV